MNAKHLVAAFAVLATTGTVLAQEFVDPAANFISTRTRAEVVAELKQAQAGGADRFLEHEYPVVRLTGTPRTRAEVLAELKQAQDDGSYYANETTYPIIPAATVSRSRSEVRAELETYRKAHAFGEIDSRYGS
ncbi:DUF4148 domain-containing protein [Noviherbaspirillum aerium]|uniref:DUF4148 domain-containing protein n=1 Tax=Noviherbaspirillum aerium TaxID=2588497 RepID=UPI00124E32C9|nr:DUF4148 domain-containing protein [Noviherbaspirillum aerium]